MQWDEKPSNAPRNSQSIVDISFKIQCKSIAADHAYALSSEIIRHLPWLPETTGAAVHLLLGPETGNGWERPLATAEQNPQIYLSRRAKLSLRLPKDRVDDALQLTGKTLQLDASVCAIGTSSIKQLNVCPIVFSRYIIANEQEPEDSFIQRVHSNLKAQGVNCLKMLCGRTHQFRFPDRVIFTRSLMIAELAPDESIYLQETGYGDGKAFGCGIFIPHKDIKPVHQAQKEH